MNVLRSIVGSLVAVVLFTTSGAAVGDELDTLTDKALKVSGITGQLDDLSTALVSAVPADAFPNARMRSEASAFVKKNASKNAHLAIVHSSVRRTMDKESLEKVIAFYDSRLGKKAGRLHDSALEPYLLKAIREGRNVMASSEESRLKTLGRVVASDRAAEANALLLNTMIRGLLEGYAGDTPQTANDGEVIREKMKIMDKSIRALENRTEDLALAAYAYTYRSLDDQELAEVAAFRESPEAAAFGEAVRNGLKNAVYITARSFAEAAVKWRGTPDVTESGAPVTKSTLPAPPAGR